MFPVLFDFGPITIYSYGFFLALAYLVGTYVLWKEGKKQGYSEEKILDLSIITLIAALIGGRILYFLINFEQFSGNLFRVFYFWEGGFAYYGSVVLVFFVGAYFVRVWRWSFLQVADISALAILAATIAAKIGSLLSGNDYGTLTSLPWGVTSQYLEGSRHPVAVYEAIFSLVLLFILFRVYHKNIKSVNFRSGAVFFYFLFFSSFARFVFEFFRGDSSLVGPIKLANILSFSLAVFALFFLYFYQFRNFRQDRENIKKYIFGLSGFRKSLRRRQNEPGTF